MEIQNLYFIAVIPDKKVSEEITLFKQDFADHYASKKALKVLPHITLKAPFMLHPVMHHKLKEWFNNLKLSGTRFRIELRNFGAFHNKHNPVVFVNPVMNDSLLLMQKEIITAFIDQFPDIEIMDLEFKFKPHVTIAYRDLEPEKFREAWKVYQHKTYEASFEVSNIYLLQHDRIKWNVIDQKGI